jgi:hypothetical protein
MNRTGARLAFQSRNRSHTMARCLVAPISSYCIYGSPTISGVPRGGVIGLG